MKLMLDLLPILVLAVLIYFGWRRGLLRGILRTFNGLLSLTLTVPIFPAVSELLKEKFVTPYLIEEIETTLNGYFAESGISADTVANSIPSGLRSFVSLFGIDLATITESALDSGKNAISEFSVNLATAVAGPISVVLGCLVTVVAVYLLLKIVDFSVGGLVEEIPLVRTINRILGAFFAAFIGFFSVWLLIKLAAVIGWSAESIDETVVCKFFYHFDPLALLLGQG